MTINSYVRIVAATTRPCARCCNVSENASRGNQRGFYAIVNARQGKYTLNNGMSGMMPVDEYFNLNHKLLTQVARGIIYRCGRKHHPEDIVTNAYIYIRDKHSAVVNHLDIQKLVIHYIRSEIERPRSATNYRKQRNSIDLVYTDNLIDVADEPDASREHYYEAIERYKANEPNLINRIVAQVYIDKGIMTVRAMAKHFGINQKDAQLYISQLKKSICNELNSNPNTKEQ